MGVSTRHWGMERPQGCSAEAARLRALQTVYWDRAWRGDGKAAQLVLKIIGERIKLWNPARTGGAASIDDERQRVLVVAGSPQQFTEQLKAVVHTGSRNPTRRRKRPSRAERADESSDAAHGSVRPRA